jgi:hypothetical protein
MAKPSPAFSLIPVLPKGKAVTFGLVGNASYGPSSGGASGGIQTIDRPLQKAATQFYDVSPREYKLELILGGAANPESIEPQCAIVDSWTDPQGGQTQPPVLAMRGPVSAQAAARYWWVNDLSFDEDRVIRDPNTEARTQQFISIDLIEYIPTTASVLTHLSPAQAAQLALAASGSSASRRVYVTKQGDTLAKIAARVLGNFALANQIAQLNGIRDPRSVAAGTRLVLPS